MIKMERWKQFIIWLLCACVIGGLCALGVLNKQKIWPSLSMKYTNPSAQWNIEKGDNYGIVATGPDFVLPPGEYRLKWKIEGDGANRIHLLSENDARITPSVIETTPDFWGEEEAYFVLHELTSGFRFEIEFCDGTWLNVMNLRMHSPIYTDLYFTLAMLIAAACLLIYALRIGWLTQERISILSILGIMVLMTSRLYLQDNSPLGWDSLFHGQRIMNLADGLKSGYFPVRVGGFSYNGYGAMTSVFYGDILLYPWALMHLAGASMSYILNTLAVFVSTCAAWSMYIAVKGMFKNKTAAVCASLLFLGCAHWMTALYRRYALGELFGMAFLPLFFLALYELIFGDKQYWMLLAASATLIFRSHFLTTLFGLGIAVMMGLMFLGKIIKEKRLDAVGYACLFAVLLNINQILPLVMSYMDGVNTSVFRFNFTEFTYLPSHVLDIRLGIGFTLVIGTIAYICAYGQLENEREKRIGNLCFVGGWLFTLMTTDLIPWSYVEVLAEDILALLQFPARFLIPGAVLLAICGGLGISKICGKAHLPAMMITLVVAIAFSVPYAEEVVGMGDLEYGQTFEADMSYPEYQIEGTMVHETRNRKPKIGEGVNLIEYEKRGTRIAAQVETNEAAEIIFPIFGFDGYRAELNGEVLEWYRGENNRLAVRVPAGTQGEIKIWYAGRTSWYVADVISLAALIGLGVLYGRKRRSVCGMKGKAE